jgi:hypothetical protein
LAASDEPSSKLHVKEMNPEELLDRVSVFREVMQTSAIEVMESELARRGVGPEEIRRHEREMRQRVIRDRHGMPAQCSFCLRAAVEQRLTWHKLWRLIPVIQRVVYYCDHHFRELASPSRSR